MCKHHIHLIFPCQGSLGRLIPPISPLGYSPRNPIASTQTPLRLMRPCVKFFPANTPLHQKSKNPLRLMPLCVKNPSVATSNNPPLCAKIPPKPFAPLPLCVKTPSQTHPTCAQSPQNHFAPLRLCVIKLPTTNLDLIRKGEPPCISHS